MPKVPSPRYNVVFESRNTTSGFAGNRTIGSYANEADFRQQFGPEQQEFDDVIAMDVDDKTAQEIAANTPPVCRLTSAIQEACDKQGNVDIKRFLDYHLTSAYLTIRYDAELSIERDLTPSLRFNLVEIAPEDTSERALLMRATLICANEYGEVDPLEYMNVIREAIILIQTIRKQQKKG